MKNSMSEIDCGHVCTVIQAMDFYVRPAVSHEERQTLSDRLSRVKTIDSAALLLLYSFWRVDVTPIANLRLFLNIALQPYLKITVVVILNKQHESGQRIAGIVVDGLSDVHNVKNRRNKNIPDFDATAGGTDYGNVMAEMGGKCGCY